MTEVTVVGSGMLLPDDSHRSPGHLIEWDRGKILLDCGSGVVHGLARDRRDWRGISHVAITHFHVDHCGDLPALLWAWRHAVPPEERGRKLLLGPIGFRRVLHALEAAHGEFILNPGPPVEVVELDPEARWTDEACGLAIRSHPARHTPEALSLIVDVEGASIGYTGDTGPHPGHASFFRDVSLLICECGVPDGSPLDIHLSPSTVAELGVAANPRRLVLTHVSPEVDRNGLAGRIRALGYAGEVIVAEDGTSFRSPLG